MAIPRAVLRGEARVAGPGSVEVGIELSRVGSQSGDGQR
jgi:hypothetical protein